MTEVNWIGLAAAEDEGRFNLVNAGDAYHAV